MFFEARSKQFFRRRLASFICFAFVLLLPLVAKAERLPVKTYTAADGLLRDGVYRIRQDSRGFLWFCTQEGVSRFDGYGFTNFTTDDGLSHRQANDFLETSRGVYLVATGAGVAKLNPHGNRISIQNPKSKIQNQNEPLFTVYLPDNPKTERFNVLYEDRDGQIWAGRREPETGGLALLESEPEANGSIVERLYTKRDGLPTNWISDLYQAGDGKFWVTTVAGLCLWQNQGETGGSSVCKTFTAKNNICDSDVRSVTEDKDGNLWTVSRCGAKKIAKYGFTTFDGTDGLGTKFVTKPKSI